MVTAKQCWDRWGDPNTTEDEGKYMVMWDVHTHLEIGVIPKRLYCNRLMIEPLTRAFTNLIERGFVNELRTWDGCFNVRKKRGLASQSLHSWGIAIDVNAAWNQLGRRPTMSAGFVKCFTDAGFDWGGTWKRVDGMHYQLSRI
jgi:hypothetical protein